VQYRTGMCPLLRRRGVRNGWKPILWFRKEARGAGYQAVLNDHLGRSKPAKLFHDHEQDSSEVTYLIERLTKPGDLVVDPCCGSGTTCLAALKLGRRTLGIEVDPHRAAVARKRIADFLQSIQVASVREPRP